MKRTLLLLLLSLTSWATLLAQDDSIADRIKLMAYGQVYAEGYFPAEGEFHHTFGVNKFEVIALGQINDRWSMGITVQFNKPTMLKDLYMQYMVLPELKIRVGQFKTPFSHENQVPPFINPLYTGGSLPTVYFAGIGMHPLYYGTAGRDTGLELSGDLFGNILSYKAVVMNGQGMNHLDLNSGKLLGGSLYIRPIDGLSLHGSYLGGDQVAMSDGLGLNQGESYVSHRASAGIIAEYKPISVAAEFMYGKDGGEDGMGAYLTTTVHLPKRYDIVLSGDYLQPDTESEACLYSATLGLNKWFHDKCRIQIQYRYTHPDEGITFQPQGHTVRTQFQFVF